MGLFKVSAVNGVRKKLMGAGNVYFYHGQAGNEWAAGRKTNLQNAGSLGILQKLQNSMATELQNYLIQMQVKAKQNFEALKFSQYHEAYPSESPISSHFYSEVLHRGKNMVGVFGNSSPHARYVEWGTGPLGEEFYSSIPRTMRDNNQKPEYRETPWTYYDPNALLIREERGYSNPTGFVFTNGMRPRPFLYPAFLRYKGAFIRDLQLICEGKTGTSDFMSSWQIGNG